MGPVATLCTLLASAEPQLPVLCVDAGAAIADDSRVRTGDVVDALRVRMHRKQLRVAACDLVQEPAAWRVSVRAAGDDVLSLTVEGELAWSHELDVHGLHAAEVSRLVALYVVEAVRPSVDAALVRLGLEPESPAPLVHEPMEKVEGVADEVSERRVSPWAIDVQAGAVFGAQPFSTAAQAQVAAKLKLTTTSLAAAMALRSMPTAERLDVVASGGELHLELAGRKRWDLVELGLHVRGRATRISIDSSNANVENGARTYWDYGVGASGLVWPWRGERFAFGIIVQATVWARPHWLSVEGQELTRQARTDVFAGPVLEFAL